ncbi:hypothetical protein GCM10009422_09550 [Brevundimonas kwangchunensis]|uniref:Uncharacterized protein n=1 Tax=Brevundimonas kwangchunensis TaxID=322163 RepID=A0ABP3RSN8_9CAUL
MLLRQAHDLLPVRGRAHARLHLVEAVEHLIEPGLGKSHGRDILSFEGGGPLTRKAAAVDATGHGPLAAK